MDDATEAGNADDGLWTAANEEGAWTSADPLFLEENEHGVADNSYCAECVALLQRCAGESREMARQRAQQEGRSDQAGWMRLDITAEDFRCQATVKWGEERSGQGEIPERTTRFTMRNVCFPAVCSYDDIEKLFAYDIKTIGVNKGGEPRDNFD
eukprot:COSAG02_NODE_29665_length_565_cov_0.927039_1_plen_153_part_01